ncbi:hypothetical protein K227x_19960 [Rubripirellula lacrimiformis]|uniref:Uncharacterized protein n=1 Tax=Rubripirellula lacrimiformis TaxID=1930273 RepID=A0A517N914_9BACT|nr:hypothetical protein [Rubripirellula lacrimiformis]QDT03612.1 hypothetical protein K227x_19960 [Rubripirellula lacrimiformis]
MTHVNPPSAAQPQPAKRSHGDSAVGNDQANHQVIHRGSDCPQGTLLWIGDRDSVDFRNIYHQCESQASQIAWRAELESALRRPAGAVDRIIVTQSTRFDIASDDLTALGTMYPNASRVNLLGSMCAAISRMPEPFFDAGRHPWHRSNQVLPRFLATHDSGLSDVPPVRSVAVIASTMANAEPLMDVAQSSGATAVWCRTPNSTTLRNIDAVWWDDSVAPPAGSQVWRRRIATFQTCDRSPRHAWIASTSSSADLEHARQGGVEMVVSKPYRIDPLLQMLANPSEQTSADLCQRRAA